MYKKTPILLLIIITFMVGETQAQSKAQYGTWTSIDVEKKFQKWNFEAETELRTIYIARLINRWSIGLSAEYKLFKPLEVGINYQLMNTLDQKYLNYQFRNRVTAYLTGKTKLGNFSFSLTEGLQGTKKNHNKRFDDYGNLDTYKIDPAWMWKNSFKTEYNIPKCKLTPGVKFDSFYELNNPAGNTFDKLRYSLYFKYKLNKRNAVKLFGVYNQELGTDVADYSGKYILGVNYSYTLK